MKILSDKPVWQLRRDICQKCDKLTDLKFCKECGCFIPAKVHLEMADCPLNKWPKVKEAN